MAAFWNGLVSRDDDERIARAYFASLARDAQDRLDRAELQRVLAPWGIGATAINRFADQLLAAGPLEFERFHREVWSIGAVRTRGIQIVLTEQAAADRDRAELVYRYADSDRDGAVTVGDLEVLLAEWGLPASEAGRYLAQVDRDGDGRLSFDEFFRGLRPFWRFIFYEVFRAQLNRRGTDDMVGRSARALLDQHRTGTLRRRVRQELLGRVPFLANAQPDLINDLAASLVETTYRAGEVIFAEGAAGEDFHIVGSGVVRVSQAGATLCDLGIGGCVGEGALLSNEPRSATVTALQDARLFSLRRSSFVYLTEKYPEVRAQLRALHASRMVHSLVRTIQEELVEQVSFLRGADARLINDLAAHLEIVRVAPGQIIFREGDPGDGFFIIEQGGAQIQIGGEEVARLGPGDCFGEGSLLSGQPRSATVVAIGACRFFRLRREAFTALTERHPEVREELLRLHSSRSSQPFPLPAFLRSPVAAG
jgi:CRP-like cAMP-binding protein/Ca2+-binding EF-hand superfamily protein